MAPPPKPGPRSKRTSMEMDDSLPLAKKVKNPCFKGEEEIKILKNEQKCGNEEGTILGPHVIKVMDKDMLDRVCQKYENMGHSIQMKNNIIKLNQIKSETCLQEEVTTNFNANMLEHTDVILVSSDNQEVPCHRFILATRSPVFKKLFASQSATIEGIPIKESVDAPAEALKAMVKYLYTDNLENAVVNEDVMNLADKYELSQMKELCLPAFVKKVNGENCLKAYIYGNLNNYEPLKHAAFMTMVEHWSKLYESSSDVTEMMKTHPNEVLEIVNRLYKRKSGVMSIKCEPGVSPKVTIKAFPCLQEEIIKAYGDKLEFTDMMLVSSSGQEVPCHR